MKDSRSGQRANRWNGAKRGRWSRATRKDRHLPKPMNALRIHLKADILRKGKMMAPQSAEQLMKVTVIKPMRISGRTRLYQRQGLEIVSHSSRWRVLLIYGIDHSISREPRWATPVGCPSQWNYCSVRVSSFPLQAAHHPSTWNTRVMINNMTHRFDSPSFSHSPNQQRTLSPACSCCISSSATVWCRAVLSSIPFDWRSFS